MAFPGPAIAERRWSAREVLGCHVVSGPPLCSFDSGCCGVGGRVSMPMAMLAGPDAGLGSGRTGPGGGPDAESSWVLAVVGFDGDQRRGGGLDDVEPAVWH
jgi:hypothetical protein